MPTFPVTVTASYDARCAPPETLRRLRAWAEDADGRTFTVDNSIAPVRWTASADYVVGASSAHDAERTAVGQFLAEAARAGIEAPETILGATGPAR
ncbi:MAG: hypothetical protein ACRDL8_17275 [Solirubrobacteraceae bacterium]